MNGISLQTVSRVKIEDKEFGGDVENGNFELYLFSRVSAKERTFRKASFQFSIFENCYFRKCHFADCNFIGAQFLSSNLRDCTFNGCKFDYSRFNATLAPHAILTRNLPDFENLARDLARSLRINYGQLGDVDGVNLAINTELHATRTHLWKAARSKEAYYRAKYQGLNRLKAHWEWGRYIVLDFIWGNGESVLKVLRSIALTDALIALILRMSGEAFPSCLLLASSLFFGVGTSKTDHYAVVACLAAFSRFVLLGLFISVLTKRLGRR
jgi:hypothetical protein